MLIKNMRYRKIYLILLAGMIFVIGLYYLLEKMYTENPSSQIYSEENNYDNLGIDKAQQFLDNKKKFSSKKDIKSSDIVNEGNIRLIKEKDFKEVAEKPKDPMAELAELARSRNKVMVKLDENELDSKINLYDKIKKEENIKRTYVPEPGKEINSVTPIYAPCNYKVFKTKDEWESFISHNKVKERLNIDFSKENVLILVSDSILPSGIFEIDSYEKKANKIIVKYRVNVFEIAEENTSSKADYYTAIKIPKGYKEVELKQIQ